MQIPHIKTALALFTVSFINKMILFAMYVIFVVFGSQNLRCNKINSAL